nr:alpha/beta fold hydrolase [Stakelama flava]
MLFDGGQDGIRLAGTLTIPAGEGPFLAALLITGSGRHDRDQTVFGHKPFLVWSDFLARRGIATLRVDDRGIGGSAGCASDATTADFAKDAKAGFAHLRAHKKIDSNRVGLLGQSEGALIASMVAAHEPNVSFVIMLGGIGIPGAQLLLEQKRLIELSEGVPSELVHASNERMEHLFEIVMQAKGAASASVALKVEWMRLAKEDGEELHDIPPEVAAIASPWMRWFLAHDPRPNLSLIRCPVLAITGGNDLQTPASSNLSEIKQALRGHADATIREVGGLNHLLQTSESGRIGEYQEIEETISPIALKIVGDWLAAMDGPRH